MGINPEKSAVAESAAPKCRFCGTGLHRTFVDLGMSPLCESFVPEEHLNHMEAFYPLHALICEECLLVQLDDYVTPEHIFTEYAYFSSYSDSWVSHAEKYVEAVIPRFGLGADSKVVELASNDGYLLQYFIKNEIPALGIEPAANIAEVAQKNDIPTENLFLGIDTAKKILN